MADTASNEISKNTKITIGAMVAIILVLLTYVAQETTFKVNTARDILDIKLQNEKIPKQLEALSNKLDYTYLSKRDFEIWLLHFRSDNPTLKVPEPK